MVSDSQVFHKILLVERRPRVSEPGAAVVLHWSLTQGSLVEVLSKRVLSFPPRAVMPTMMAIAISATSRPYSTAEAPRSVLAMP